MNKILYHCAFISLACISIVFGVTQKSSATNLRPGRIFLNGYETGLNIVGKPQVTSFIIRNDSIYDAPTFPVYIAIVDPHNAVVFRDTLTGLNLKARDSVQMVSSRTWMPLLPGQYTVQVDVEYSQDVIPSDNIKSQPFFFFRELSSTNGQFRINRYDRPFVSSKDTIAKLEFDIGGPIVKNKFYIFGGYETHEVVIKNLWVPPHPVVPTTILRQLDYTILPLTGDSIPMLVVVSDTPMFAIPQKPDTTPQVVIIPIVHIAIPIYNDDALLDSIQPPALPPFVPVTPPPHSPVLSDTVFRHNMSNVDLDSTHFNPGTVPGYAGDKNACGPAAAANSMDWLEKEHDQIKTDSSLRAKLVELSAMMRRGAEEGVSTRQLVYGKLAFIDKHKLPIHVKFQSFYVKADSTKLTSPDPRYGHSATNVSDPSLPRAEFWHLLREMKNGEDVELMGGWYDSTGKRTSGHWFAVNSIGLVDGDPHILISHDVDQSKGGGTVEEEMSFDTTTNPIGPVGREWCNPAKKKVFIIESVVSESFDTTIKFGTTTGRVDGHSSASFASLVKNPIAADEPIKLNVTAEEGSIVSVVVMGIDGERTDIEWHGRITNSVPIVLDDHRLASGVYIIEVRYQGDTQYLKLVRE
jgi:hypothetical protein